jgi:large subunit ribosomal protein L29
MPRRIEKFREMKPSELEMQERELSEQIFRLRFQLASGQAESLKKLREARRDLARVKTLLRERQLAAQAPAAGKGK